MLRPPRLLLPLLLPGLAAAALVAAALLYAAAWAGPSGLEGALSSGMLVYSVCLSLATASASTLLALLLAIPTAYGLSRGLVPAAAVVEALTLLPFAMPPVAVGVLLLLLLAGPASWAERLLHLLFTPRGLVAAQLAVVYPMAVRVLRSSFDSVPARLEAVARSLGCSWWCSFTRIVLPLASRGVAAAAALSFLRSLGEFGASAILAGVKPDTATIPIAIYLAYSGGDTVSAVGLVTVSAAGAAAGVAALRRLENQRRA